jgi:VWFA-related protein
MLSTRRFGMFALVLLACFLSMCLLAVANSKDDTPPVPIGKEEKVAVRLVLVDLMVFDRQDRAVEGLGKDDFTLLIQNRQVPIDTLDHSCDPGQQVGTNEEEASLSPGRASVPRTVLLFDNYHMDMGDRIAAIEHAGKIVDSRSPDQSGEVMVAVLTEGLRVLQPFTTDPAKMSSALASMQEDVTIWARIFEPPYRPLTEKGYFEDLGRLMNILMGYDGLKTVVMFSSFLGKSDQDDLWYLDVAHRAAESRTLLYPVYARGVEPPDASRATEPLGGSRGLARLANESGGRFTRMTNNLVVGYERAQQDQTCRYTLGFYMKAAGNNKVEETRNVIVRVRGRGRSVRHPERIREWSPEDLREAAFTVAEYNPDRYLDPDLELGLDLMKPKNRRKWKVRGWARIAAAVETGNREPVGKSRMIFLVSQNRKVLKRFETSISSPGQIQEAWTFGLPPGDYELTAVLDDPSRPAPITAVGSMTLPALVPDPAEQAE